MSAKGTKFHPKQTFRYSPLPPHISEPMPIVKVRFKKIHHPILGLVDSGATKSLIHPKLAEIVGIKFNKRKYGIGTGAGSDFRFFQGTPVDIGIKNIWKTINFTIIANDDFFWGCLLGHDFFKQAKIIFKSYNKQFDIFFKK
jgi:hypothetical protein